MIYVNNVRNTLGIDDLFRYGYSGSNVNVAIIDTGLYSGHRDLRDSILEFKDVINDRLIPYDDNGHGTHVAGIVAASGMCSNGFYRGIAPKSKIIVVKALNAKGKGKANDVIKGIEWIKKHRKKYNIRIVNISIGTVAESKSEKDKDENIRLIECVEELWELGIIVVAAAGNNGPEIGSITVPGVSRKIITVGVSDDYKGIKRGRQGKIVNYSGRGPVDCVMKPEIVAPGSGIMSCTNRYNSYTTKSGTSMATPIVSGTIALALSVNQGLYNYEIKDFLKKSAIDLKYSRHHQGWGLINPKGLIDLCK